MEEEKCCRFFSKLFEDIDRDRIRHKVENLRDEFPGLSCEQLAHKIMGQEALYCAFTGACTGALPWPWLILGTAPDMITLLSMQSSVVICIAQLYGFDPEPKERMIEVLGCLGASAGAVAGTYGIRRLVDKKLSDFIVGRLIQKVMTYMAPKIGARLIPVIGAVTGAAFNYGSVMATGKIACDYYRKKGLEEERTDFQ